MMEHETKHWDGTKNKMIRWYFYIQRGLALINEFRYLFMLIFGVYVVMKMTNPVWLVVMFVVTVPVLIVLGWAQVHHMAKVMDWLGIQFGSYWSRYSFELMERQLKALENIDKRMRRGKLVVRSVILSK